MLLWVIAIATGLLAVEIGFRAFLRLRRITFVVPRTHRDLYVVPHPYLPYVYRPNTVVGNLQTAPYPLHRGRFEFRPHRINNIRFFNEDVSVEAEPGVRRIMCLGGSTTANSLWVVGDPNEYSYPLCLRESLTRMDPGMRYEVLNCGMGGWTSAEILINFVLHLIDLRPALIVLYHGFNDLEASLTSPFASDYSHSRKNFGEAYARIKLASRLPNLRPWKSYAFLKSRLLGFGNVRYDLLSSVRAGRPSLDNPFMGLDTERRNVRHLIQLCRANGIRVLLATFAYHVHERVREDRQVLKYQDGVRMENQVWRELAREYELPLVDLADLVPDEDAYFVDTIHFTPEGMRCVADHIARCIVERVWPICGDGRVRRSGVPV